MIRHNDQSEIMRSFLEKRPRYVALGDTISEAIVVLLKEKGINFLLVEHRTKDTLQFIEKINRKKYVDPLEDMEDICGLRIVCYFQKDIKKIEAIIKKEFSVIEYLNKTNKTPHSQFGYRSNHLVVKVKDEWKKIPHAKHLVDLKSEIQVRTILMHAWGEIEHKLAYKKKQHIPTKFRRKFSRLSAKLEEADEQFQELADDIAKYKKSIIKKAKEEKIPQENLRLDLDLLQSLMDFYLPQYDRNMKETRDFLDQVINKDLSTKKIIRCLEGMTAEFTLERKPNTQIRILRKVLNGKERAN